MDKHKNKNAQRWHTPPLPRGKFEDDPSLETQQSTVHTPKTRFDRPGATCGGNQTTEMGFDTSWANTEKEWCGAGDDMVCAEKVVPEIKPRRKDDRMDRAPKPHNTKKAKQPRTVWPLPSDVATNGCN